MFANMKTSEKLMAGAVGIMILVSALFYGVFDYLDQSKKNSQRLKQIKKQIQEEKYKMEFAIAASDRQGLFYEPISFPADQNQITAYQDWLETTIRKCGLRGTSISEAKKSKLTSREDNGTVNVLGAKYVIRCDCKGTLNEIIAFFFEFEQLELLQKIKDVTLQPLAGPSASVGDVKAIFSVEFLVLKNAEADRDFRTSIRDLPKSLDEYRNTIIARNIFGPANNAPAISVSKKTVEEEEEISVSVTGRDKDETDELTWEIVDDGGLKNADIKSSSKTRAKFTADAMPIGEYVAVIKVTDNGFPQKSSEKELKVVVEKKEEKIASRPKAKDEPVPESPTTQINRISSRNGVFEIKIRNRMKGDSHVLSKGESFELDGKTWVVREVERLRAHIEVDGRLLEFRIGDFLGEPRNETDLNGKPSKPSSETVFSPDDGS